MYCNKSGKDSHLKSHFFFVFKGQYEKNHLIISFFSSSHNEVSLTFL